MKLKDDGANESEQALISIDDLNSAILNSSSSNILDSEIDEILSGSNLLPQALNIKYASNMVEKYYRWRFVLGTVVQTRWEALVKVLGPLTSTGINLFHMQCAYSRKYSGTGWEAPDTREMLGAMSLGDCPRFVILKGDPSFRDSIPLRFWKARQGDFDKDNRDLVLGPAEEDLSKMKTTAKKA